ncbi:MAG: peptide chain release factor 1 [Clostridiales Family XIII bacterium]|jgi:peptide chain release factor 1|nr:peptide chain release factor 1 [Clostridiales Family XIII bacterium]
MNNKLEKLLIKYDDLLKKVSDKDVILDQKKFQEITKELNSIEDTRNKYLEYKKNIVEISDCENLLTSDLTKEDRELFEEEKRKLETKKEIILDELKILLLPKDDNDDKNVILEIRAGTGGEEASLFASDLLRMYLRFSERMNFKTELIELNETGLDGVKEAVILIKGKDAYAKLKYESGVHRVQRVPETESSGRLHTSAATVAVLPEIDDASVDLNKEDVRVDVYRSSGNGGQSVNTTDSAVRLTHEPTGIVVTCQDEKSQIKNKDKAFKVLKSRLYEKQMEEKNKEIANQRKYMVGSGDRSERIRTYNFAQNRISDHRINLTLYKLPDFMDGDLEEVIEKLRTDAQAKKISEVEN